MNVLSKVIKFCKKISNKMSCRKRSNEDTQLNNEKNSRDTQLNNEINSRDTQLNNEINSRDTQLNNEINSREMKHINKSTENSEPEREEREHKRMKLDKKLGTDSSSIEDESVKQKELERIKSFEKDISEKQKELERSKQLIEQLEKDLSEGKKLYEELASSNENNINSLKRKLEEKETELEGKEDEFSKLEEKNAELRKEASKYQSALGNATNIRLGDEESVKFREDILSLQKSLENYVTNLKPNMDIDFEKVQVLAQKYGCSTPVDKNHKPFIKALLQRKALDDILELSKDSADKDGDVRLELGIENKTRELLELIENFSASRSGTDETAKVASIKVRQQVYGILGNRGFADVTDSNGNHIHDFITYVSENLNNTMNQYRIIKDSDKKRDVESIAPKLIQDIYKLFYYLLNVQEPRVEYKFCEAGSKIEPNVMKGNWDEDDVPQLCVDICSFPMIGRDLDSQNWKIYTHAKVYSYDTSKAS